MQDALCAGGPGHLTIERWLEALGVHAHGAGIRDLDHAVLAWACLLLQMSALSCSISTPAAETAFNLGQYPSSPLPAFCED